MKAAKSAEQKVRLLIQALVCEVVRERTKLGMAIAANNPMIATTIIISTNVNPRFP